MSEKSDPPPSAAPEEAPAKKGGLPIKTIAIVAAMMVAEGAAVFVFVGKTGAQPQSASAKVIEGAGAADLESSVEVPLLQEKFQNMQTGRAWIWDTEVVLKVRSRNEVFINKELERRTAEIKEGVSLIFRRAPHSQLKEPGLETINRQLTAYLNSVLGKDAEGKERLERVVIPRCKGFPAD